MQHAALKPLINTYRVMSSVLTARGVPGGTAASTFDDAYLDELSNTVSKTKMIRHDDYALAGWHVYIFVANIVSKHLNTYHPTVNGIVMIAQPGQAIEPGRNPLHFGQYY